MSHRVLERPTVAKKRKPNQGEPVEYRDRVDLRADPALVRRISRQSHRFALSLSAYIREAVLQRLEKDEATDPQSE